jgi:hypothetical protein
MATATICWRRPSATFGSVSVSRIVCRKSTELNSFDLTRLSSAHIPSERHTITSSISLKTLTGIAVERHGSFLSDRRKRFLRTDRFTAELSSQNGETKNVLWVRIEGERYAFSYNHSARMIEMRRGGTHGETLHTFSNATPLTQVYQIFAAL